MDNFSSSDLDSPSKTPLFIAIAAVVVGLGGLGLGWMGFSKASALERQLARLDGVAEGMEAIESGLSQSADRVDQVAMNMNRLSEDVNTVIQVIEGDVSKIKRDVRSVAIDAGTARKKVEELEKKMTTAAVATPRPSASGSASSATTPPPPPGEGGIYTIKKGDTLGKIAAAYKITLSQLQAANPGIDPRRLRIGQQIVIPGGN